MTGGDEGGCSEASACTTPRFRQSMVKYDGGTVELLACVATVKPDSGRVVVAHRRQ
jgi:hypothetical protein